MSRQLVTNADLLGPFFTQANADARYLQLTGGSINGNLSVTGAVTGNGSVPVGGTSGQVLAKTSATNYALGWVDQTGGGGSSLTPPLYTDSSSWVEQRNGTTAQNLRVYRSYTDTANYERLQLGSIASGVGVMYEPLGTGVARNLYLGTAGATGAVVIRTQNTDRWQFDIVGNLRAVTDNAFDIGFSAASGRPRDVWVGRNLTVGGIITGNGSVPAGGTANQVLAKTSATDYAVGWATPSGGGGGSVAVLVYEAQAVTGSTVTLPSVPTTNGVTEVAVNGQSLIQTRDWTISGAVITFTPALTADDVHIEYQVGPTTLISGSAHYETVLSVGQSTLTLPVTPTGGSLLVTRDGVTQYQGVGHYSLAGAVLTLGTPIETGELGRISVDFMAGGGAYLPLGGGTLSGNLLFNPDSTVDIGAAGGRPRDLILGRNLQISGRVAIADNIDASYGLKVNGALWAFSIAIGGGTLALNGPITWGDANHAVVAGGGLGNVMRLQEYGGVWDFYRDLYASNVKVFSLKAISSSHLSLETSQGFAFLASKAGSHLGGNAYWDGTNWNRYDVAKGAAYAYASDSGFAVATALAGANPATFANRISVPIVGPATLPAGTAQQLLGQVVNPGAWTHPGTGFATTNLTYTGTFTGAVVRIDVTFCYQSSGYIHAPLYRDGASLMGSGPAYPASGATYQTVAYTFYDTPTAGSHTYALWIYASAAGVTSVGGTLQALFVTEQRC